jgi:hypothetical protein
MPNPILALTAIFFLSALQLARAGEQTVDPPNSGLEMNDPEVARPPNLEVWVGMRSKSKRSARYVLKQLQSAATSNGMSCDLQENESSQLLCQFQGPLYNAIGARDDGTKHLGIEFYHLDDEGEQIDPAREATINSIIHQFASELKRSGQVREIERCSFRHRECKSL